MMIFLFWLFFCGLVSVYASSKGRSAFGFFLLSAILSPLIGLLIALIVENRSEEKAVKTGEMKECPKCAEHVKSKAQVCRYCDHQFKEVAVTTKVVETDDPRTDEELVNAVINDGARDAIRELDRRGIPLPEGTRLS